MISNKLHLDASNFALNLKDNGFKSAQMYIDDFNKFKIAFFGAVLAGICPIILPKPIFDKDIAIINDENFGEFLLKRYDKLLSFDNSSCFYLKTSGTSGSSKMVKKSLKSMFLEAKFLAGQLQISQNTTFICSVSHQHMFGLTFKLFLPMACGANVVPRELNYPELIFENELKGNVFITSPVLIEAVLAHKNAHRIGEFDFIISAGSPLKYSLRSTLKEYGVKNIIDLYGSTETGAIARNYGDGLRIFSAVSAGVDERGTLNVKSPWCDFFQSNDIAVIKDDRLELFGRIDRIIKLHDKRISLESIENSLLQSGLLNDVSCGIHQQFNRACAILQLNENGILKFKKYGKKGLVDELKKYAGEYSNALRYFKIVPKVPRNSQSKVSKSDFYNSFNTKYFPSWKLVNTNANFFEFKSYIDPSCEYFISHFPCFPVIPGFIQLDFVFELAKSKGIPISNSKRIENIKFTNFLQPADEATLTLQTKGNATYFQIFVKDKKCSSGKILHDE